jgi:hypothetical protein
VVRLEHHALQNTSALALVRKKINRFHGRRCYLFSRDILDVLEQCLHVSGSF